MAKNAYISTKPNSVSFSLRYSDNSGERMKVILEGKMTDVLITDNDDSILIPVEDIDWLRQVLDDIKQFIKMENPEKQQS